jgi:hypothetical protein
MPITPDEAPGLFAQGIKLFNGIKDAAVAVKALPTPLTFCAVAKALGVPETSVIYVLGETVDLVVKDIAS